MEKCCYYHCNLQKDRLICCSIVKLLTLITILVIYSCLYFCYVQRSLISSSVRRDTQWYLNWGEYSWKITFSLFLNLYKDVLLCWLIRPLLKLITILDELEDTKGAIRIRISKKNRQHNDQKKKYKRTNNDQQDIHIKLMLE